VEQTLDKTIGDRYALRVRKHLTGIEVERPIEGSRSEKRDRCLVLLMYRHGLRVSEAIALR
jgi:site-specific recombinase XerD